MANYPATLTHEGLLDMADFRRDDVKGFGIRRGSSGVAVAIDIFIGQETVSYRIGMSPDGKTRTYTRGPTAERR